MRARRSRPAKEAALSILIFCTFATAALPSPPATGESPVADNGNAGAGRDAGSDFDNLEIVDAGLKGKIAILRVGSQVGENHLLSVFAGVKNKTPHRIVLEVETIYRDQAGDALNSGSWIPITLKPHQETEYHSASISELAVDYLVRVRRAQAPAVHTRG